MAAAPIPMFSGGAGMPANPLSTNPTGVQGGGTTGAGAPVLGASPWAGGTVPTGSGVTSGAVPVGSPTGTLSTLTGTAGATPTIGQIATGENNQTITGGQQTQRQSDRTLGELQNYYGEGVGSYIYGLLQTGGLNMDLLNQVDTSQIAAMQPQIAEGEANLNATLGAQGIGANSSTSALANSNYLSQATTAENAQVAQNYLGQYDQGQQLIQSILNGVLNVNAKGTANQPSVLDDITSALGLGQAGTSLYTSLSNIIPGLG